MKLGKYIFASILLFGGSAFSVEIQIGQNKMICANEEFGSFEMQFSVSDKVIETEYSKSENEMQIATWEHLEAQLDYVLFTSGKSVRPSGVQALLKGIKLSILRYAEMGPSFGKAEAYLQFPKGKLPTEILMIDHNHAKQYGTTELGAQAMLRDGSFSQIFFKCH